MPRAGQQRRDFGARHAADDALAIVGAAQRQPALGQFHLRQIDHPEKQRHRIAARAIGQVNPYRTADPRGRQNRRAGRQRQRQIGNSGGVFFGLDHDFADDISADIRPADLDAHAPVSCHRAAISHRLKPADNVGIDHRHPQGQRSRPGLADHHAQRQRGDTGRGRRAGKRLSAGRNRQAGQRKHHRYWPPDAVVPATLPGRNDAPPP